MPGEIKANLQQRYQSLTSQDLASITSSREMLEFFQRAATAVEQFMVGPGVGKAVANWLLGDVAARLNSEDLSADQSRVDPEQVASLVERVTDQTISNRAAKTVFSRVWENGGSVDQAIDQLNLRQVSDSGELEAAIDAVLAANAKQVEDYRAGKEKAFNSLVGQVMRATKGKANPQEASRLLKEKLGG